MVILIPVSNTFGLIINVSTFFDPFAALPFKSDKHIPFLRDTGIAAHEMRWE